MLFYLLHSSVGYGGAFLITFVISMPIIISLSELLKRYVDDPGIRVANWIYQTIFKPKPIMEPAIEPVASSSMVVETVEKTEQEAVR